MNVLEAPALPAGNPERTRPEDVFPWLAPTRTSEGGRTTTAEDASPLQAYWGMPRRIRLLPDDASTAPCDLCGRAAHPVVREYVTKNLGVRYDESWRHPLSPYRQDKTGLNLPLHGDRAGLTYRHWLGLVQTFQDPGGQSLRPALVVAAADNQDHRRARASLRLWAFGYAMDKMTALAWCEGTMPLVLVPPELREGYERETERLILGAREVERALGFAVRQALSRPGDLEPMPAEVDLRFWEETEAPFFERLAPLGDALAAGDDAALIRHGWHRFLCRVAERTFQALSGSGHFEAIDPRRVALAWKSLQKSLHGPKLRQMLDLPAGSAPPPTAQPTLPGGTP